MADRQLLFHQNCNQDIATILAAMSPDSVERQPRKWFLSRLTETYQNIYNNPDLGEPVAPDWGRYDERRISVRIAPVSNYPFLVTFIKLSSGSIAVLGIIDTINYYKTLVGKVVVSG